MDHGAEWVEWDGKTRTLTPLAPFENATASPAILEDGRLVITTLQGEMTVEIGDWITIGIELKPEYARQAAERCQQLSLLAEGAA